MKKSYLFLANGFEEIEAIATVDILRRANIDVTTVSVYNDPEVVGAHGVPVKADMVFADCDFSQADWLILPGGLPGADNLLACDGLAKLLKEHNDAGKHIAAICASPAVVLAQLGILEKRKATAYPGFEEKLVAAGATPTFERVTVDGNITTGNGPATAFPFALAIVEQTMGKDVAETVASGMLYK